MEEREEHTLSYEEDVYGWSLRQAELLREGRYDEVDIENVAEEIESVGRSQVASLRLSYRFIATQILKLLFHPERFTRGWHSTIVRERFNAEAYLRESPSLGSRSSEIFAEAYAQARRLASAETGLPVKAFPSEPPFTLEQASSEGYQPWSALADSAAPGA